ncbi:MAG: hypothetical protein LBL74_06875 [Bacteroidales bacterium]|jgi:hypothetical protein|nr:hypothetical protein [Bacteroidales bacterium]
MKKIMVLIAIIAMGISVNAQTQQMYIEESPIVIKSKEIMKQDPIGHTCDGGGWSRIIVIKVELVKKSSGEKWTRKRLVGYLSCETGSRMNQFSEKELNYYSRELNLVGKFAEYEYERSR